MMTIQSACRGPQEHAAAAPHTQHSWRRSGMTFRTQARRRAVMAVALLILVLALALAACAGGRGARRDNGSAASAGNGGNTTQQGGQLSGAASDVVSADQDIQAVMQQLDAAQSDANADLSAQDSPVEP